MGQTDVNDYIMYYTGNNDPQHYNDVAIIMDPKSKRAVKRFVPISDRIILIQIKAYPKHLNIIQVYASTAQKPEHEINIFHKSIKDLLKISNKSAVNIIIGDFNAKTGKGRVEDIVGDYGLGERNIRGTVL